VTTVGKPTTSRSASSGVAARGTYQPKENSLTIVWIIIVIILVLLAIGLARRVL
jgi:hypothetical protein